MNYKKYCSERFQFVLVNKKNDIICQRYFEIKQYKTEVFTSIIITKKLIDKCANLVANDLKVKSEDYQYKKNRLNLTNKIKLIEHSSYLVFKIIIDDKIRIMKLIPTGIYPPTIRYNINIRHIIPIIIKLIQKVLSNKLNLLY